MPASGDGQADTRSRRHHCAPIVPWRRASCASARRASSTISSHDAHVRPLVDDCFTRAHAARAVTPGHNLATEALRWNDRSRWLDAGIIQVRTGGWR